MAVEGELQDPRPGHSELVAESVDIRRDQSQVLGDERECSELLLDRAEEIGARAREPIGPIAPSMPRPARARRPRTPKVIQANHVHVGEQGAHAIDAPAIAGAAQRVPVIDRVAPELSLELK